MGFHPGGFPALSGMSVNTVCFNSYASYTKCLEEPGKVLNQLKSQL